MTNFKTFEYAAMADEQGKTYHTHIFIYFSSRVRYSTVKKAFPEAHIDSVKGTVSDNINYIKKSGKWKDSEKAETSIPDTFEEIGKRPPDSQGKSVEMRELYQMISDGMTNAEIIGLNQDYILHIDKLDKVRTTVLRERYNNIRRNLEVIYCYGETGTGKTRGILDKYGDSNVYRVTDYQHPFDGYNCQPVICFDEFRSSLMLKDMLNYCDIYPIELPARYANKFACFDKVYIVSNWELEKQYSEIQKDDAESWDAFLRRIHKVQVYKDGTVKEYDSVESYMNHKSEWHSMSNEEATTIESIFKD
jgi:hypothetical protein